MSSYACDNQGGNKLSEFITSEINRVSKIKTKNPDEPIINDLDSLATSSAEDIDIQVQKAKIDSVNHSVHLQNLQIEKVFLSDVSVKNVANYESVNA